jgi:hypothetical protein
LFFVIGCCYGASTFYHAALIYIESYYTMPHGVCKNMVLAMAAVFFTSWFMFPGLFLAGPEGTNALSWAGSTIGELPLSPIYLATPLSLLSINPSESIARAEFCTTSNYLVFLAP